MATEKLLRDRRQIFKVFARDAYFVSGRLRRAHAFSVQRRTPEALDDCRLALLQLNDRWSAFCRRLLVASAVGGDGFAGRLPGVSGINSEADVMAALSIRRPWKDDHAWHVSSDFLGAARKLGVRNLTLLNGSIGATPNPSEPIRLTRNFFAHRNPDTYARAYIACGQHPPEQFCLNSRTRGELSTIVWVAELIAISRAATE